MHQFETLSVPVLKKGDAAYGTPRYLVHWPGDRMATPALISFDVRFITNCDDEPPMNNVVAITLQRLWIGAIHAGAYLEGYRVVAAGLTDANPQCYPFLRAAARASVAHELASRALGGFNQNPSSDRNVVVLSRAMKTSPYYAHILALWTSVMTALDMPFPGFDHASYNFGLEYGKAAAVIHEHLPNDVHCQEIANWYSLLVPPTPIPSAPS